MQVKITGNQKLVTSMKRTIKKVAILGSGVMGSRIACHFAGIGVPVLLLDIVPKDVPADAKPAQRNKIVNDALQAALKSNPSPLRPIPARCPASGPPAIAAAYKPSDQGDGCR